MSKTTEGFNFTLKILNWTTAATNKVREVILEVKLKNYCSDVWNVKVMLSSAHFQA